MISACGKHDEIKLDELHDAEPTPGLAAPATAVLSLADVRLLNDGLGGVWACTRAEMSAESPISFSKYVMRSERLA